MNFPRNTRINPAPTPLTDASLGPESEKVFAVKVLGYFKSSVWIALLKNLDNLDNLDF